MKHYFTDFPMNKVFNSYYFTCEIWTKMGLGEAILVMSLMLLTSILYFKKRKISQSKEMFKLMSHGTMDGFFVLEPIRDKHHAIVDFVITEVNERGAMMFEKNVNSLIGCHLNNWFTGSFGQKLFRYYRRVFVNQSTLEQPEVYIRENGCLKGKWISHRVISTSVGIAVTIRDITQAKKHEESIHWLANHDAITNVCNRLGLEQQLPKLLDKAKIRKENVTLYFIDLDNFKKINDRFGHASGDIVLSTVAKRLSEISRQTDLVGRLGGDEFIFIASNILTETSMLELGQRILNKLHEPIALKNQMVHVGASIGVSYFPEHGKNACELLKSADLAMYKAKYKGKGLCEFFIHHLSTEEENQIKLQQELQLALENDEFYLVFQPKIHLQTHHLLGIEALIRWKSSLHGVVCPKDFIPIAEKSGLILPIGENVLQKTCQQIVEWKKMGYEVPPISVNISSKQLYKGQLSHFLKSILLTYDLLPEVLEIEITEHCIFDNLDISWQELKAIKELGLKVSVDDFGSGYNSLALLKEFKIDELKVDKSFIQTSNIDNSLVQTFISIAKCLNMSIVAQGIETQEQMTLLQNLGYYEGQGFYFSQPIEATDLVSWFKK
jgi:diguanylate cyclase (GGDEF)-like protein